MALSSELSPLLQCWPTDGFCLLEARIMVPADPHTDAGNFLRCFKVGKSTHPWASRVLFALLKTLHTGSNIPRRFMCEADTAGLGELQRVWSK